MCLNRKGFMELDAILSILIVTMIVLVVNSTVRYHVRCMEEIERELVELEEVYEENMRQ